MPFKPNYNQQRAERNRAKEQKKQEKLQRRAAKSQDEEDGVLQAGEPDTGSPADEQTNP